MDLGVHGKAGKFSRQMAEREGLLGLWPRPCGAAVALLRRSARLSRLSNRFLNYRGFESSLVVDLGVHGKAGKFSRQMAEREGFEPSMELLTPYSLSRGAPSAARPSLLWNQPPTKMDRGLYSAKLLAVREPFYCKSPKFCRFVSGLRGPLSRLPLRRFRRFFLVECARRFLPDAPRHPSVR